MKLIIAGCRNYTPDLNWLLHQSHVMGISGVTEIISGGATGVDLTAKALAQLGDLPFKEFPADWKKYGKAAGPIRNEQMADYADALLAVWDGKSRGTHNMILHMNVRNKPVYIVRIPE